MKFVRFATDDDPSYGILEVDNDEEVVIAVSGDPLFGELRPTGARHKLADLRLLAPVIPRSKVIGIGRNYAAHAAELGNEVPAEPVVFIKPNTAVVGPDDLVVMPSYSKEVHCEGELAVIIGRLCKDISPAQAAAVIAGYTCANDVTARDAQRSDATWARGKGFDTSCPLGPVWVTSLDTSDLHLRTEVDGQVVQSDSTSSMIHSVPELVAYVSSIFTLLPGDVILTGTPAGVTAVPEGSSVSVTIEGIGTLRNQFIRR